MKKRQIFLTFAAAAVAMTASARTVALWPVEYDIGRRSWNPYSQANAVDESYPLRAHSINLDLSIDNLQTGWELPPNPDPSVPIERARNRRAVAALSGDGNAPALCCENLGADYLTRMHDYTVEMYVKLLDLRSARTRPATHRITTTAGW